MILENTMIDNDEKSKNINDVTESNKSDEKSKTINVTQSDKSNEKAKAINIEQQTNKSDEKPKTISESPQLDKDEKTKVNTSTKTKESNVSKINDMDKIIRKNILEEKNKSKRKESRSKDWKNGEPISKFRRVIKNKTFIITMGSVLLGASAITIGTVIPVLLIDNTTLAVNYVEIIKNYNLKTPLEKIADYNKMTSLNNGDIIKYFFDNPMNINKKTGLYHWVANNLDISENITLGNDFINFLANIWTNNVSSIASITSINNTTFNNFLLAFNESGATNTQSTDINKYWTMNTKTDPSSFGIKSINMYSTFIEYIDDINIDTNLAMNISFKPNILNKNLPFKITNNSNITSTFKYKSVISINDITLFPGATKYIKKDILKIN